MSVEFSVAWDGTPSEWWGVAKFSLTNNSSAVLEDPKIEFTVESRQNVSANSGLTIQRANGSNLVKGRIETWVPNKISPGQTVHFTVGIGPNDGKAGVGFLPSNLKVNGHGGHDQRPTVPGRLRVESTTATSMTVAWDPSTSPVGIDHYEMSWNRQGGEPGQTPVHGTSHTVKDLRPDTEYRFAVYAVDVQGRSSTIATTGGKTLPDGPPPPPPGDYPASAPFVSATAWPTPRLRKIHRESGVAGFFLGFIAPRQVDGRWRATWAALEKTYDKYERSDDEQCSSPNYGTTHSSTTADSGYLKWLITPLQERGVKFALSVGGANAHPLEEYTSVEEAVAEYIASLDNYNTVFLDFDIEGSALGSDEHRDKHVQVLNEIRRRRPDVKISHTLAVDRDGWNHSTIRLMDKIAASGFKPDLMIGMLMEMRGTEDYLAITKMSAEAMVAQMRQKFGWSESEAWGRFGACPMYGENYNKRVFTPDDMRAFVSWARGKGVAMMSGWDASRDYNQANPKRTCEETPDCSGAAGGLDGCTKVAQQHLEFCKAAASYNRSGPEPLASEGYGSAPAAGAVSASGYQGAMPVPMSVQADEDGPGGFATPGPVPLLSPESGCCPNVNVTVNVNVNDGGNSGGDCQPVPKALPRRRNHDTFKCVSREKYSGDEWSWMDLNLCCRERKVADGYEYDITWDGAAQYYWGGTWRWDRYGGEFDWEIADNSEVRASGREAYSGADIVRNQPVTIKLAKRPTKLRFSFVKSGGYWASKGYPSSSRIYDSVDVPHPE